MNTPNTPVPTRTADSSTEDARHLVRRAARRRQTSGLQGWLSVLAVAFVATSSLANIPNDWQGAAPNAPGMFASEQESSNEADATPFDPGEIETEPGFEPNAGRYDSRVDHVLRASDTTILIGNGAVVIDSPDDPPTESDTPASEPPADPKTEPGAPEDEQLTGTTALLSFVGADPDVEPTVAAMAGPPTNYLIGDDPTKWLTDVRSAGVIEYTNLIGTTDVRFLALDDGFRFDVQVEPGTDPSTILIDAAGAGLSIAEDGHLDIELTSDETVELSAPIAFQETPEGQVAVEAEFVLTDSDTFGFAVGEYDESLPLVIDPTLDLGTFVGTSGTEDLYDVVLDSSDNIIVTGQTTSGSYPTTAGVYDQTQNGNTDIVVSKFNAAGTALLWSTFIGGSGNDYSEQMVLAADGDILIAGSSQSSNFPTTTGAYDRTYAGNDDVVVFELSSTGSALTASTYLGGADDEVANGIDVAPDGTVVVAGEVFSTSGFPATGGAYDTTKAGTNSTSDGFVTKLSAALTAVSFSTFLGGTSNDSMESVDVTGSGTIYVSGSTASSTMPTVNAYDSTYNGSGDIWVGRLSSTGASLQYGTFLGGSGDDTGPTAIKVGTTGLVYNASSATSGFPTSGNAYDGSTSGNDTALAVLDTTLTGAAQLHYGSFLGGTNGGWATDLAIDSFGRAYIVGDADASGLATAGAPDTTRASGYDGILAVLNPTSGALELLTYIGGASSELAFGVALDSTQRSVVVGGTASSSGIATTAGAYDTTHNGANDGFIHRYTALGSPTGVTVNSTDDDSDNNIGNGVCSTGQTNTSGATECTLRAAIQEANASGGIDTIEFEIPTADGDYEASPVAFRIQPGPDLPNITSPVTIDGTTQTEFAAQNRPVIVLDGITGSGSGDENGLALNAGSSTIRGLVIQRFGDDGIEIDVNGGNTIVGNFIGTDATGTLARPNGTTNVFPVAGISVKTSSNVIGGLTAADRNVLSGSTQFGVAIRAGGASNVVQGNYIGVDVTGTATLGNTRAGVAISGGGDNNAVGGVAAGAGNVISANGTFGVEIFDETTDGTIVQGNTIGLNAAGTALRGNVGDAVNITGGSDDVQLIDNLIAHPGGDGIEVAGASTGTIVQGNTIGTDTAGTADFSGRFAGVSLSGGADQTLIGGTGGGEGNTIANAGSNGANPNSITIESGAGNNNSVLGNELRDSRGIGIDLGLDGATPNDSGDGDPGPNGLLNTPELTSATESGGTVTVTFDLDVPANTDQYRVEFFTNPGGANLGSNWEGETFVSAVTTSAGNAITHNFAGSSGGVVTATATRIDTGAASGYSATSEFSPPLTVATMPSFTVNSTGDSGDSTLGDGLCDTSGTNSQGAAECTLRAAIQEANASLGDHTIIFNTPTSETGHSAGIWTITPTAALPQITETTTIDATTQPGYAGSPIVWIDGNSTSGASGIRFGATSDSSQISGFAIIRFDVDGVLIGTGADDITISDNWIGSDGTGATTAGNDDDGIDVNGTDALIEGNVVSNSNDEGIDIRATGATIVGNVIGLEFDGSTGAGNNDVGIAVFANDTTIGGPSTADRNVISMNWEGIEVNSSGNLIQGNYIGTDSTGALDRGNRIGTGIDLNSGSVNLVGGSGPTDGNVIAFNQTQGVRIAGGTGHSVIGNSIHSNGALGIDVGATGAATNDSGDGDAGANDLLNHPIITSAVESGGTVTVTIDLDVPANADQYRVEFFTNPSGADSSGNGEGEEFETALTTAPGTGLVHTFPGAAGDIVAATATRIDSGVATGYSSTSEFSPTFTATSSTLDPVVLDGIQSGTTVLANGSATTTATIAAVDPTKAFLTYTMRGNDANPDNIAVTGELTNATTVTFSRFGTTGNVTLEWSVVEFSSGVTVQRGSATLAAATTDLPISSVDLASSFVLTNSRAVGTTFGENDFPRAALTSSTNLRISIVGSNTNTVKWQVVQYNDAVVQRGTASFGTGDSSRTAAVSAVDTAKAWLVHSNSVQDDVNANIGQKLVRGQVTNSTTLTFDRSSTGTPMDVAWELVEFTDTAQVQHASVAFATADTTKNVTITAVDSARSIAVGGNTLFGGRTAYTADDNPGAGWFTTSLTTPTNLRVQRDANVAAADLGWFVIEWPADPTVTVNSTDDDSDATPGDGVCDTGSTNSQGQPECTLRATIEEANASAGVDTIEFAIPITEAGHSGGVWTITPTSELDTIDAAVTIDGTSQPGFASTPVIELNGASAGAGSDGLSVFSAGVEIRGLSINRFLENGIEIDGTASNTVVAGNHIGVDPSGLVERGNSVKGIEIQSGSSGATIGGSSPADRNVISGNGDDGVVIWNSTDNVVIGNYIGTDVNGNDPMPNGADGVVLGGGASNNTIGQPAAGNVLSGNVHDGFENDATGAGNTVQANLIGLGEDGTTPVPNGRHGVVLYNGANNTQVGGTGAGEGNTISSNVTTGIVIDGNSNPATIDNVITGNLIGTDTSGLLDKGNGSHGVHVFGSASGNTIGSTVAGRGNTIAFNTTGVRVQSSDDIAVIGNDIHSNSSLGIDRVGGTEDGSGVTANGSGGPNDGLNHPIPTSAVESGGTVTVDFDLDAPAGDYRVEAFSNPSGVDPSGYGEGEAFEDGTVITHTGAGAEPFQIVYAGAIGDQVTLTATERSAGPTYGSTSEFSSATTVSTSTLDPVVLDNVQAGTTVLANGSSTTTATIPAVDPAKAFLTYTVRGTSANPSDIWVTGELTNSTTVTFTRESTSGDMTIEWSVTEFISGVSVQRGVASISATTTNVAITSAALATSFPIISHRAGGTTFGNNDFIRASLTSPTNLRLEIPGTFSNVVPWQVVTYNDAAVQYGTVSFGTGDATRTDTITSVDTTKSWLTYSLTTDSGTTADIGQKLVRGRITDDTTLTFDRSNTGQNMTLQWYLVEFTDSTEVQHASVAFGSSDLTQNVAINAVDPNRSISTGGYLGYGGRSAYSGDDNPGVAWFTTELTSATNLRVQRDAALATADLGWFVIEWPADPTVTVNSTDDDSDAAAGNGLCDTGQLNSQGDPECTLRAAIEEANASVGVVAIEFAIPDSDLGHQNLGAGNSYWSIQPATSLPVVTGDETTIDATTQATYASGQGAFFNAFGPSIELDGSAALGTGLEISANDTTIRALVINRFARGLALTGGDNNTIVGNYVGPDVSGAVGAVGNTSDGIYIYGATNTTIGGTSAGDRNVISGNRQRGLWINDWSDGAPAISNGTVVIGNYVGTNANGSAALPYDGGGAIQQMGIALWNGPDNTFGGPGLGEGNVLSGNSWHGLYVWGAESTGNVVQGNTIGLDQTRTIAIGNGSDNPLSRSGVIISNAPGNLIGGPGATDGNIIAGNDAAGAAVTLSVGNSFLGNEVYDNDGIGLDLGLDSVTTNDAGDVDPGANDLLNFPEASGITESGGTVTVDFDLDVPAGSYRIEVFTNPSGADPTGWGEGEQFENATSVTHTGSGAESFQLTYSGATSDIVSLTTTEDLGGGSFGSTSEYSLASPICADLDGDLDGDGLLDCEEDANTDLDGDPSTNPGPNTDGDANPNYLDDDDDGDALLTINENADPNSDGDPRDARDSDRDGQPDYLDAPTTSTSGGVATEQKISDTSGGLAGVLDDNDTFGRSVASIGDIDGDGITDIAVGAFNDDDGGNSRGAVYVLFMNANGTVKSEQKISSTTGGLTGPLGDTDLFGVAVAGPGDIDGDGINDLVVGARSDDDGGTGRGAVYVLFLDTDGTVRAEQKISSTTGGLTGPLNDDDQFGISVAGPGDVDGDGINDLVVGANLDDDDGTDRGAAYILLLDADGTVKGETKISSASAALTGALGDGDEFGAGVAGIGDVDADGTPDVAVGARFDDDGGTDRGAVYVLLLNTDGSIKAAQKISSTAGGFGGSIADDDRFGFALGGIGDLDGDATPDLVVGAYLADDGGSQRGVVHVLNLNTDGTVNGATRISSTDGDLTGPLDNSDNFGVAVAGTGDLDADGTIGLVVGARFDDDGGTDRGAVYVLDLTPTPTSNIVTVNSTGDGDDSNVGNSLCSTGGLNSEGQPECTLRAAITEANASGLVDTIEFAIPASDTGQTAGVSRIEPGAQLPIIATTMTIDATTQLGYATTPIIEIYGAGNSGDGFNISSGASSVTIRGFALGGFASNDIDASGNDHIIVGNHLGVTADGVSPFPITTSSASVLLQAGTGTTVGGAAVERNIVTNAGGVGVSILSGSHSILGNSIFDNGGIGIDIAGDSVTTPDAGDLDGVPNQPTLLGAVESSGTTVIDLVLDAPIGTYTIQYFDNPSGADPTGYGEGEVFIASVSVAITSASAAVLRHVVPGTGLTISTTATHVSTGATSEFSNAIDGATAGPLRIDDLSIRRSDLTMLGGTPTSVTGAAADAIALDGSDDLLVGPALDVTDGTLALSASILADTLAGGDAVISKRASDGGVIYELGIDGATSEAVATIDVTGTPIEVRGGTITASTWQQLDAVWDGATFTLYVDGVTVDSSAAVGTLRTDVLTRMTVGARSDGTRTLDGAVDNVQVGHGTNSADRIAARQANLDGGGFITVGREQTDAPGSWATSAVQTRSGGFSLAAPVTTGSGSAGWAVARDIDEPGIVFESYWYLTQAGTLDIASGTRATVRQIDQYSGAAVGSSTSVELRQPSGDTDTVDASAVSAIPTGRWVPVEIWTDQLGDTRLIIDGVEVIGWTSQGGTLTSGSAGLLVNELPIGEAWYVDDARARKLITPEPSTSLGVLDRN